MVRASFQQALELLKVVSWLHVSAYPRLVESRHPMLGIMWGQRGIKRLRFSVVARQRGRQTVRSTTGNGSAWYPDPDAPPRGAGLGAWRTVHVVVIQHLRSKPSGFAFSHRLGILNRLGYKLALKTRQFISVGSTGDTPRDRTDSANTRVTINSR